MASMEVDGTKTSNGSSEIAINGNGVHLPPVLPDASGEGFPYAPTNWPNPGDNWTWRVGKRVAMTGHFLDRYLYLPKRLPHVDSTSGKKHGFASKLSVERYIQEKFPGSDIDAFFASFSWKIPAKQLSIDVKASTLSPGVSPQPETENVEEGKESTTSAVKRKTKHTAAASSVKRQTRQSRRQSINVAGSPNKEEAASDMKNTAYVDDDLFAGETSPGEDIPKEFDNYLDSLVNSLAQPLSEAPLPHSVPVNSSSEENELVGAQMLEENKAEVTSLRNEYNELKEKASLLQVEIDSTLLSFQGIDDQIAQLQSQRTELISTIEAKKMEKLRLTINQKKVADAIQRFVHENQLKTQGHNGR